jgi:hypothetical protein
MAEMARRRLGLGMRWGWGRARHGARAEERRLQQQAWAGKTGIEQALLAHGIAHRGSNADCIPCTI